MISNTLDEKSAQLAIAIAFRDKYGEALGADSRSYLYDTQCDLCDAALAGEVFGKRCWTREPYYDKINWVREIDGMRVVIENAEEQQLKGSPVPPSAFPLQLTEGDDK